MSVLEELVSSYPEGNARCGTRPAKHKAVPVFDSLERRIVCSAGQLDPTFDGTGKQFLLFPDGAGAHAVAVQSDEKVVMVGSSSASFGGGPAFDIARVDADGSPDTSFGSDGEVILPITSGPAVVDETNAVVIQPDGKIIVVGSSPGPEAAAFTVLRLTSSGQLDTTFGTGGVQLISFPTPSFASSVAIQPDGKILVAGLTNTSSSTAPEFAIARLNTNGTLDTTFGTAGVQILSAFGAYGISGISPAMTLQSDSKIILAGNEPAGPGGPPPIVAVRLNSNGSPDSTFGNGGIKVLSQTATFLIFAVNAVGIQPDGAIVIAGGPDDTGGPDGLDVARLTASGTIDTSFNQTGEVSITSSNSVFGFKPQANSVVVQPNGQIIAAGSLGDPDTDFELARLNPNGSVDKTFGTSGIQSITFNPQTNSSGNATALALTPDGKLIVAGVAQPTNGNGFNYGL